MHILNSLVLCIGKTKILNSYEISTQFYPFKLVLNPSFKLTNYSLWIWYWLRLSISCYQLKSIPPIKRQHLGEWSRVVPAKHFHFTEKQIPQCLVKVKFLDKISKNRDIINTIAQIYSVILSLNVVHYIVKLLFHQ